MKSVLKICLLSLVSGFTFSSTDGPINDKENSSTTLTSPISPGTSSSVSALSTSNSPPSSKSNTTGESLQPGVRLDKTSFLEYLLNEGSKLFFYTRDRILGRSLILKMLCSYFRADKAFFEGTQIRGNTFHQSNPTWTVYPIIFLDFSNITYEDFGTYTRKAKEFEKKLRSALKDIAALYKINNTAGPDFGLSVLIQELQRKYNLPVVVLIDEYDSPIKTALRSNQKQKFIDSLAEAFVTIIENQLAQIYHNVKHLRFAWVTGEHKLHLSKTLTKRFVDVTRVEELEAAVSYMENNTQLYL